MSSPSLRRPAGAGSIPEEPPRPSPAPASIPAGPQPPQHAAGAGIFRRYAAPGLLSAAVLALWQALVDGFQIPAWLLPSPWLIFQTLVQRREALWLDALATLPTVLLGFGLAFVTGVALAVLIRFFPLLGRALYPWLLVNQTVPTIAIAPLLVTWLGFSLRARLLVVTFICFFPICTGAVDGFRSVDRRLVQLMQTMGASPWRIFWHVEVPSALPFLLSGTKVAVSVSVVAAVISEWVGASRGLGHLIVRSAAQLATPQVFAALLVLSVMGLAFYGLVLLAARLLMPWHPAAGHRPARGKTPPTRRNGLEGEYTRG